MQTYFTLSGIRIQRLLQAAFVMKNGWLYPFEFQLITIALRFFLKK